MTFRALLPGDDDGPAPAGVDRSALEAVDAAVAAQAERVTAGIEDIAGYSAAQNDDVSHREVIGPQLPGGGASGVVAVGGRVIAQWGDPARPEMAFSVTKSFVSLVAGLAFDDGLLELDAPVAAAADLDELRTPPADRITWRHLLEQTSGWAGTLWGKPASVDAQSTGWAGSGPPDAGPGEGWAYNDVRVNLLCLALTVLLRRPLPELLAERVMRPLGASDAWSWHGYRTSSVRLGGVDVAVPSGGGHWGGGLWIGAADLARVGELYRRGGLGLLSPEWIERSWTPSALRGDYGLLWWLGSDALPGAPGTGRLARGNRRRHALWVDPARDLVVASHWGDEVETLVRHICAAVPARDA